ncbi:MAG: Uma2 family endonuclease [Spirosomataceae bacterium]
MTRTLKPPKEIPKSLIYEELDGQLVFYKGYREVLSGKKTMEEIMGSSGIQIFIHSLIFGFLTKILPKIYFIGGNEAGLHLAKNSNLSNDILVFEKSKFLKKALTPNYTDFPPLLVIEVDIKGEAADFGNDLNYYTKKANRLLDFGVLQLVWVFTDIKKILIAEPNKRWIFTDWDDEFFLLGEYPFCLAHLIEEEDLDWRTLGEAPTE